MTGKRPAQVPTITGQGFENPRDPTPDELNAVVIPSYERATDEDQALVGAGWNGGLYGTICLTLANDNKTVDSGCFWLVGKVFRANWFSVQGAKFWQAADETRLELSLPDATIFKFPDSLASEWLDSSELTHRFVDKEGKVLADETLAELEIRGFAIRAFVIPTRENYAKISIGLVPLPKDALFEQHPLAENPLFPCISVSSPGEFPLGPPVTSQAPRAPRQWGFPFWPLLVRGADASSCPAFPRGAELRAKMAAILRSAVKPEMKNGLALLQRRMEDIQEAGASNLKQLNLEKRWPLPEPQPDTGWSCFPIF